jgi:hypothetical protein
MDWDMLVAGSHGEGAAYEKKRKAKLAKDKEADRERAAAEKWTVAVTVKSATILKSTDGNGLSDPYAEVYIGDDSTWRRIGTTKVQSKTLEPVWNERFEATLTGLQSWVKVKLYDKDRFGSDYIGTWKEYSHSRGGDDLTFHPKDDRMVTTAKASIVVKWTHI